MRTTVTIARQLGCGGSYIGQQLASGLGVRCLDREIVSRTADDLTYDEEELAAREERVPTFWERMLGGLASGSPDALYVPPPSFEISDQELFDAETKVMKTIAEQENCVIVGRAAAHVLPNHAGSVHIFLHAPLKFRIERVKAFYHAPSDADAQAMIERSDDIRKRFINQMTGADMTNAENYDLCLNTCLLPLPDVADYLLTFVRQRMAQLSGK